MKAQNKVVKHLYDSSYMRPNENYRVVQDTNPVKAAIMDQAQKRHELQMTENTNLHNHNLSLHFGRVDADNADFQREYANKKASQMQFSNTIGK